ncbi:sugar ABC transporter substrate-binding protein [Nesterenkonia haasae]|uniref:sugar ABC transporter substrate-binding protein n=1 Tax=Nesterenkonia haasae TaxID=2587813 RepID=UPI001291D5C6|nr:sugar ABC transporter substrate-binding protein [Nesterenkonia haasae]NDK31843.1 substrate-binding domain-containing protein [Nesterenkonia haasae]
MKSSLRFGAVAAAGALLLTSCGGDSPDNGDNGAEAAEGLDICYVTAAESHAYVSPANAAFQDAADELEVDVTLLSQEFEAQTGTDQLRTCIGRNPDGIVLWPLDPQAYIPGLVEAQDAGIPLVLINSPMDEEAEGLYTSFTGPDTYEQGQLAGDVLDEELGSEGNVVIIAGQAGNGTTIGRTDGFNDKLEELGSDIEVVQTVNADFDQQRALELSRDVLSQHGDDLQGVYANDDTMARGFIDAWTESGRDLEDMPAIVGINGQQDAFESIEEGYYTATIVQSPEEDGRLALETIVGAATGEEVDSRIPIPLTVVTEENVADEEPAF